MTESDADRLQRDIDDAFRRATELHRARANPPARREMERQAQQRPVPAYGSRERMESIKLHVAVRGLAPELVEIRGLLEAGNGAPPGTTNQPAQRAAEIERIRQAKEKEARTQQREERGR